MQKFDLINTQIMRWLPYYQKPIIGINPRIQAKKWLISYYKTNGIISLKKHGDADHFFIRQMFEEEMNNLLRKNEEDSHQRKNESIWRVN
jgi:hypothetical protein